MRISSSFCKPIAFGRLKLYSFGFTALLLPCQYKIFSFLLFRLGLVIVAAVLGRSVYIMYTFYNHDSYFCRVDRLSFMIDLSFLNIRSSFSAVVRKILGSILFFCGRVLFSSFFFPLFFVFFSSSFPPHRVFFFLLKKK